MRFFVALVFSMFFVACSSYQIYGNRPSLTFNNFKDLKVGQTHRSDAQARLGIPSKKEISDDSERWIYETDGYQRLTLTFSKTDTLNSSLWVPYSEERESNAANIKTLFPSGKFKELKSVQLNPHVFPTTSTLFVDEGLGISMLVEDEGIQSIAFFDPKAEREMASKPQPSPSIPISIGK